MKISVIIPIYNVEHFIGRCVKTLMEQTLDDVEFIFVNDATTDNSMSVLNKTLKSYPNRLHQVKIINHNDNKGLPAARNTGLNVASGKYIFHCDSDDYLEPDILLNLYEEAERQGADYVWCDYSVDLGSEHHFIGQPTMANVDLAIRCALAGNLVYNVWNKLVAKELYEKNNIEFPAGYAMGEDMTMIMLLACASKVAHIQYLGYHYVTTNSDALTKKFYKLDNIQSLKYNIQRVTDYLHEKFGEKYFEETSYFKLSLKWSLLAFCHDVKCYKLWHDWFPETNNFIFRQNVSLRVKVVEWLASKRQYWLVKLHYILVIKCFYKLRGK